MSPCTPPPQKKGHIWWSTPLPRNILTLSTGPIRTIYQALKFGPSWACDDEKQKNLMSPFLEIEPLIFWKSSHDFLQKGPSDFFVFNQLEPWDAPILKPSIRLQWVRSKMLIFFRGGVCSKTLILQKMVENQNGLDILPWVTKVRPDFGLRFSLGPFLHTTLIVDMRWTIIAEVKI